MSNDISKTSDPGFVHSEITGVNTAQHIPCSTETITSSCTLCGFTGNPKEFANHNCFANPDDPPRNRFDPFEALDKINRLVAEHDDGRCVGDIWKIEFQVDALRAYITGITT